VDVHFRTPASNLTAFRVLGSLAILAACSGEPRSPTAPTNVAAPVTPPPEPPPLSAPQAECAAAKPAWIWCDDFEQDRLSRYFEYGDAGGRFTRASGAGYSGSTGMRAHWTQGAMDAGFLHLAMGRTPHPDLLPVDAGTAVYREVFWRIYVKNQVGWVGGGADKLTRALSFASSSFAEAAFGHVWSGIGAPANNYLMIDPASGTDVNGNLLTTTYNDFSHMRWLGAALGKTPLFDASHVGQWHCIEAHIRLNASGQSDGVFEVWVDGLLDSQRSGLNFVGTAPYGINAVYFENYWNAGTGAPVAEERYLDNIVVSTGRIGCI
jgi:hypothetical protein